MKCLSWELRRDCFSFICYLSRFSVLRIGLNFTVLFSCNKFKRISKSLLLQSFLAKQIRTLAVETFCWWQSCSQNLPTPPPPSAPSNNSFWAVSLPLSAVDQSGCWFPTLALSLALFALYSLLPVDGTDFSQPVYTAAPPDLNINTAVAGHLYSSNAEAFVCSLMATRQGEYKGCLSEQVKTP